MTWQNLTIALALVVSLSVAARQAPAPSRGTDPTAPTVGAPLPPEGPELSDQIDRLTLQLAALQRHQAELAGEMDMLAADISPMEEAPPSIEDLAQEDARTALATLTGLEDAWSSNPAGGGGAESAQVDLRGLFDALLSPDGGSHQTQCRGSLCRVELRFAVPEAREAVMGRLPQDLPWPGEGFVYSDPQDPMHIRIFIGQAGFQLPRP